MAGSRPTAWVGQFPLAWERERVVVSFRVLPNVRHVKGNRLALHFPSMYGTKYFDENFLGKSQNLMGNTQ
eukprot:COSAG02_NODE_46_length_45443_cov_36.731497_16_plen_70_part_00